MSTCWHYSQLSQSFCWADILALGLHPVAGFLVKSIYENISGVVTLKRLIWPSHHFLSQKLSFHKFYLKAKLPIMFTACFTLNAFLTRKLSKYQLLAHAFERENYWDESDSNQTRTWLQIMIVYHFMSRPSPL